MRSLIVVLALVLAPAASAHHGDELPIFAAKGPHVTVIGDSVLTAIAWDGGPLRVLETNVGADVDAAICRRTVGESCLYDGYRPPTVVDLAQDEGPFLAPLVVIECGYNDDEATFGQTVATGVQALLASGVRHVFWLTLHGSDRQRTDMNAQLEAVAAVTPAMSVIDWNAQSAGHADWFQPDGTHLYGRGGFEMAALIRDSVLRYDR